MNKYIKVQTLMVSCLVALSVGTAATVSRAESTTAQENLEKLKKTNTCRGCDLSGLTLNRLNLVGADLEGADFSMTKFQLSNLSGANLRNANLKGASFGGTDLGEADLRGADMRGTSLDGAYLENALLDGEFVTARPYEEIGVTDVEKQVYVPNPGKPKKSPQTREVKVAAGPGFEKPPTPLAAETAAKPSVEEKSDTAEKVAVTPGQIGAPAAKKAVPVRQAIVEPQQAENATPQPTGSPESATTKTAKAESAATTVSIANSAPKKKASPVVPAEVITAGVKAQKKEKATVDGSAPVPGESSALDRVKQDKLARLLGDDKCFGCDLSGLDLSGKDLRNVDLEQANLSGCNLERVILDKANLKGAILQNAVLRMASLKNADLYKADLSGADLSGANVEGAKLDNAKLARAIGLGSVIK